MLWICKFCRPDKEFTPHPGINKAQVVIRLSSQSAVAGGNESERGISPSLMRQAARRTYRIACPTVAWVPINHPLLLHCQRCPPLNCLHTSCLSPAPRSRPGTPPFYVRARTSREREFLVPPVQAPAPGKCPSLSYGLRLNPSHSCTSKPTGPSSCRCIVRRPSG